MLLYVTLTLWTPYLIYFWVSILSLCIAPFLFNPHQFVFTDFIVDYRYVSLSSMESTLTMILVNSCAGCLGAIFAHTTIRGFGIAVCRPRAGWRAVFWSEIVFPICMAILFVIAYMFVKSVPEPNIDSLPVYRPGLAAFHQNYSFPTPITFGLVQRATGGYPTRIPLFTRFVTF
jgi:1,3-beta-glucan synthase